MAGLVASDEAHGVEVRHEEISMDEHGGVVLTKEMGEGGGYSANSRERRWASALGSGQSQRQR
jgi:hypothetical protein